MNNKTSYLTSVSDKQKSPRDFSGNKTLSVNFQNIIQAAFLIIP